MNELVTEPAALGRWTADPGFGVYVHIPFCRHRCNYCDFNTYEGLDELHGRYVDALIDHVSRLDDRFPAATSIFFGGGTPTLLPPAALARVLTAIDERVGIAEGAEITIEANPETVDEAVFERLLEAGFNRISIGVQSLAAHVLERLERTHSAARALRAVRQARAAGADNVSVDLIFGSPWETLADWRATLDGTLDVEPDHVSAYALTVEDGTPLAMLVSQGRAPDVDPDVQAERWETANEVLSLAGYERYEVSNWARPGRPARHNVLYWCAGDYLALGAGAHGHLDGRRFWNVRLPRDYIARAGSPRGAEAGSETLDARSRAAEALVLGLRLASGVDAAGFAARFGRALFEDLKPALEDLRADGLLEARRDVIRLAARGTLVANEVACRLL